MFQPFAAVRNRHSKMTLAQNRDACHVPPKTSSEFYQTFVCVIHPTAKCCCSGNLHKRTSLWLFLQIPLCYNFRWHNISESWISDFINYLWYILPQPAVADVIVDFSHLNLLPTYQSTLDLDESSRWSISKNHHFQSQRKRKPHLKALKIHVFLMYISFGRPKLPQGHVDKQYMHWLGVSLAIPRVV